MRIAAIVAGAAMLVAPGRLGAAQAGTGAVRVEQGALADDRGVWNPLGASLFWALWAERYDTAKLERNLDFLATRGVDYVRVFAMVGADSWRDRTIDPAAPHYWNTVERLFERIADHGLRVQVTLFADAQVMMPDADARRRFVDSWAAIANRHRARVLAIEVANEYWQNGFTGEAGLAALRVLGERLAAATTIPVAVSSAPAPDAWCGLYAGVLGVDLATVHYDRRMDGPDGVWGPAVHSAGYPAAFDAGCRGQLPRAVVSNEPIGPASSVASDADPLRLALAFAAAFVGGNAAYVYHSGAGIRGGGAADVARGRAGDFAGVDAAALSAIAETRAHLPSGVANWQRHDAASAGMPWTGFGAAVERGDLVQALASTSGNRVVGVLLGIRRAHHVTARRAMTVTLVHPVTGAVAARASLAAGSPWTIPADLPGYLIVGEW